MFHTSCVQSLSVELSLGVRNARYTNRIASIEVGMVGNALPAVGMVGMGMDGGGENPGIPPGGKPGGRGNPEGSAPGGRENPDGSAPRGKPDGSGKGGGRSDMAEEEESQSRNCNQITASEIPSID